MDFSQRENYLGRFKDKRLDKRAKYHLQLNLIIFERVLSMGIYNKWKQLSIKSRKGFKTSLTGLKDEAILILQKKFGENALTETKQKSKWLILLAQFTDRMIIIILIIAAIISFVSGEHSDTYVIVAIIIANAWMGLSQQYNAEKSISLLQKMALPFALELRNNNLIKIDLNKLVPGDIILL